MRDKTAALIAAKSLSEDEVAAMCEAMDRHDDRVRGAPCRTLADAIAKADSVLMALEEGERPNATISAAETLRQVMAWMSARVTVSASVVRP